MGNNQHCGMYGFMDPLHKPFNQSDTIRSRFAVGSSSSRCASIATARARATSGVSPPESLRAFAFTEIAHPNKG